MTMRNVTIDFATPADDAAIRALLQREAMPGRIRLAFTREPEFARGCSVAGDDYRVLVARADDDVVGVACRSTRTVFVNGAEQRLGYLGQLRVDQRFRGRWLVSRGFSLLAELDREDPVRAYFLSIVDANDEATGVLVRKRRKTFPRVHPIAEYCTVAIRVAPARPVPLSARHDLGEIARFLRTHGKDRNLFPVWSEERLRSLEAYGLNDFSVVRRNGRIAGIAALWDQSSFKQSVVRGYSGWLRAVAWTGLPTGLPRVGEALKSAYTSLICVANDDRAVFAELLRELHALAGARGVHYLLTGLDARDPLLPVARAYRHYFYPSRLYLASWSNGEQLHELLDRRPVYVDIASL